MRQCPHFYSNISFSTIQVSILILFYSVYAVTIYYRAQHNHHESNPAFTQAHPDSKNKGLPSLRIGPQNTFVDYSIMIELKSLIRLAAINSVLSATLFIGDPKHVENPISEEKFVNEVLGFVIDTRKMVVTYPEDKKKDLLLILSENKPW